MSPVLEALDHLSVVNRFLKHYYTIKVQKPHELYKFYGEDSKLCVGRSTEKTARQYLGIKSIQQYFAEDHPETAKESGARVQVHTIDWQPLPDDGLMILVVGHVVVPEPKSIDEKFVHTIYLVPHRTQTSVVYYVQNDILRYMGREEVIVRPAPVEVESEAHAHPHVHVHAHAHPPQHPVHEQTHVAHTSPPEETEIHHPPPPHAPPATHEPVPHKHEHAEPPVEQHVPEPKPAPAPAPEAEPKHTPVEEETTQEVDSSEHVSISMEGAASDVQEVNGEGQQEGLTAPSEEVKTEPAATESVEEATGDKAHEHPPAPEATEAPQVTVEEPATTTPPAPQPELEPEPEATPTPAPAQVEPTPAQEQAPTPVPEQPPHTETTQPPASPSMPKSPKPARAKEVDTKEKEEKEKKHTEESVESKEEEKKEEVAPAAVTPAAAEVKAEDTPSAPANEPAPSAPAQPPAPTTWAALAKAAGGTAPVLERPVPVITNVPKKAPAPVSAPVAQRRPEPPNRTNGEAPSTHPPRTERQERTPDRKGPALFINNVPPGVTEEELVAFFAEKMPKEFKIRGRSITQQKGQHTGRFGFVDIETQDGVTWCLNNGPWVLRGVTLNVQNRVDPKTARSGPHPHQDHRGDDARRGARGGRGGRGGYPSRPQGDRTTFQQKRAGQEQA